MQDELTVEAEVVLVVVVLVAVLADAVTGVLVSYNQLMRFRGGVGVKPGHAQKRDTRKTRASAKFGAQVHETVKPQQSKTRTCAKPEDA